MDIEVAIRTVWDYMHMDHQLRKVDIIFALGSHDIRVAERAAQLWPRWVGSIFSVCWFGNYSFT
jgi:hypothetical protein